MARVKTIKPKYMKVLSKSFAKVPAHVLQHIDLMMTVVEEMNEVLGDRRLDQYQGTMEALIELKSYYFLKKQHATVMYNAEDDSEGREQIWFKV